MAAEPKNPGKSTSVDDGDAPLGAKLSGFLRNDPVVADDPGSSGSRPSGGAGTTSAPRKPAPSGKKKNPGAKNKNQSGAKKNQSGAKNKNQSSPRGGTTTAEAPPRERPPRQRPPQAQQHQPAPAMEVSTAAPAPTWRDRRAAGKLRARKVRRLVRHIEPWSVLKIALLFNFCLWVIFMIAGVLMWRAADRSNTIDNIENFIQELFALESFAFEADQIFRTCAIGGLVLTVALTGFAVLMSVLFNLISDLTGGLRVTVIEEETARVWPRRSRKNIG